MPNAFRLQKKMVNHLFLRILQTSSEKKSSYCPKPGSGGYSILIALYKNNATNEKNKMWKNELTEAAEEYSTESMTRTKPGAKQYYTPWSTSTTLGTIHILRKYLSEILPEIIE